MRAVWLAGVIFIGLPASASDEAFSEAVTRGPWAGCVYQDDFDPYPITLTPRGGDFFVSYPGLCTGGHVVPNFEAAYDAIEIIVVDAENCLQSVPLSYTLYREQLRIDYHAGASGTFALLQQLAPGMTAPACSMGEAIS